MNKTTYAKLEKECLRTVLDLHKKAGSGHIGASLSCLNILVYLFFFQMKKEDFFVLSKGHAATSLYTVLAKSGRIPEEILKTYYKDGTHLAAHPPCSKSVNDIVFGTGSLGHGLSLATGLALSTRFTGLERNVFCVISEGDCNEGSTWEAALFASHHGLKNLFVIVDRNHLQAFGRSQDVLNLEPLSEKFSAFGFQTFEINNGHDIDSLYHAFSLAQLSNLPRPTCIIAHTTKGHGVSFMENKLEWHYLPMTDGQYVQALSEIKKPYAQRAVTSNKISSVKR